MTRQTFIYRAWDADGQLLYLGITDNPARRWGQHRSGSVWPALTARCKLYGPFERPTALRMEREATAAERPAYAGGRGIRRSSYVPRIRAVVEPPWGPQHRAAFDLLWQNDPRRSAGHAGLVAAATDAVRQLDSRQQDAA